MPTLDLGQVVGPPGADGATGPRGPRGKGAARFVVGTSTAGWTAGDVDYLCDGISDEEEINDAIQALPDYGGEVVILDGTYNITASVTVNKNAVMLAGSGQSTVLKCAIISSSGGKVVIHVTSSGNTVQNLKIDGNNDVESAGIFLYNCNNNTLNGNICTKCGRGIYLSGSSNNAITGNSCTQNSGYGIYLSSSIGADCFYNAITGNSCTNNSNYGICMNNCENNAINCNICSSNSAGGGICMSDSINNAITGNTCNNNNDFGIYMSDSINNAITGNTCNNNNACGIYMSDSSNNAITGNSCIRGSGLSSDYSSYQETILLNGSGNNYNLIVGNNIMGKNYTAVGGASNTFANNKYN